MTMKFWHSQTAILLTLGITSTALLPVAQAITAPVLTAQQFPDSWRSSELPRGTLIPTEYEEAERIVVSPSESLDDIKLTVSQDIRSNRGTVMIPVDSVIHGRLEPVEGGTQFIAERVVYPDGTERPIDAVSDVMDRREVITRESNPDFLRGAAIGGGAAAVISEIFGRIDLWKVVLGAGAGVLAEVLLNRDREREVIVIEPDELDLTLQSSFDDRL